VSGKKDYYGIPPARSQKSLDSLVLKIHQAGLQIACHSNGDREIDMILSAIENAQQVNPRNDARHRIEHCSVVNQEIMNRVKNDHIIPVFHCYINQLGTQLLVYGSPRLSMMMATKTALDKGIIFALHSDYPVSRYEPMIRVASAVNRKTSEGIILGANQKITPEEAITAYTAGGAYTSFEENKKGRIAAGQFADVVVLDKDPTTIDNDEIQNIKILRTIVGGKIVYELQ
jgi:predicted amidohydrolase YtcJ